MKPTIKLSFILFLLLLFSNLVYADSPITSTDFYKAYLNVDIVKKAIKEKVMNQEFAVYLDNPKIPLDMRIAVINALSWDFNGKKNAKLFFSYLALKNGKIDRDLSLDDLTGDELLCYGYLTVMDDYFHPEKAIPILEKAQSKINNSFTVEIILTLTKTQQIMDKNWCEVWLETEKVLNNKKLKKDMRHKAKKIIVNYMKLYEKDCK